MAGLLYDDDKTPTHTNYDAPLTSTYRTWSRVLVKITAKEEIIDISSDDETAVEDGIDGVPLAGAVGRGSNASGAENPNHSSKKKRKPKPNASDWDHGLMRAAKRGKKYRQEAKIFGPRTTKGNLREDMKPGSVKKEQESNRRLYCCHEGDTPTSVATKLNLFENDSDPIGRLIYDNRSNHRGLKPDTSMKEGAIFVIPLPPATHQEI